MDLRHSTRLGHLLDLGRYLVPLAILAPLLFVAQSSVDGRTSVGEVPASTYWMSDSSEDATPTAAEEDAAEEAYPDAHEGPAIILWDEFPADRPCAEGTEDLARDPAADDVSRKSTH